MSKLEREKASLEEERSDIIKARAKAELEVGQILMHTHHMGSKS